jgi:hypothetical protein
MEQAFGEAEEGKSQHPQNETDHESSRPLSQDWDLRVSEIAGFKFIISLRSASGGSNYPSNLVTLCPLHHDLVHQMSFQREEKPNFLREPHRPYGVLN